MLKLLVCLITAALIGAAMLQLRQQRLEISHQNSQLNDRINAQQARLWSQQMQIAIYTAPNAIQQTVKSHDMKMISQSPAALRNSNWMDVTRNPDAE